MTRRALLVVALLFGALPVSSGALTSSACASEGPRAALVVDTGSGVHRYCVQLPGDGVSGIDVIKLAGSQHGLQYKLGFGGQAVCQLAGVGPDGGDCFADDPYFWGYWRGDGSGGWTWSSSGAGSTVVRDGGVEGWSWGTGRDGNSHPAPPATGFDGVCPAAPPPPSGGSKPAAAPAGPEGDGAAGAPRGSGSDRPEAPPSKAKKATKRAAKRAAARVVTDQSGGARADGTTSPGSPAPPVADMERSSAVRPEERTTGPPPAGLAGLAVAGLLGILALRRGRRRASR